MYTFFDYIFYRLVKAYFKWDGKDGATAVTGVSMIQALLLFDVIIFISKFIYDRSETKAYSKIIAMIGVGIFGLIFIRNYFKYKNKYNSIRNYYKNEARRSYVRKGILVILALILPWIPLILIGVYW